MIRVLFICYGRSQSVSLLAAEMRQIGVGEAEGDYGFTTTEERKVNNVKALIRESQGHLRDLFALFR